MNQFGVGVLIFAVLAALLWWLAPFAWWVLCLLWQYEPFANTVAALGILLVCAGIAFGGMKLLDWFYRVWGSGGMNGM